MSNFSKFLAAALPAAACASSLHGQICYDLSYREPVQDGLELQVSTWFGDPAIVALSEAGLTTFVGNPTNFTSAFTPIPFALPQSLSTLGGLALGDPAQNGVPWALVTSLGGAEIFIGETANVAEFFQDVGIVASARGRDIEFVDVNGDGEEDAIIATQFGLQVFESIAAVFQPLPIVDIPGEFHRFRSLDQDQDGDVDAFVIAEPQTNELQFYIDSPTGYVESQPPFDLAGLGEVATIDAAFSSAGVLQIFVTTRLTSGSSLLVFSDPAGTGVYPNPTLHPLPALPTAGMGVGDADADGDSDVVVCLEGDGPIVFYQDASTNLSSSQNLMLPAVDAELADFDGDGVTDIALLRPVDDSLDILTVETFLRGDMNDNGAVDGLTDPIYLLNYLFSGGFPPPNFDAADANDDGVVNLIDVTYLLFYFNNGGPEPPAPFQAPGTDPTPDSLPCP